MAIVINVTRYGKTDHSFINMNLQYGDLKSTQLFFSNFFSLHIVKVWSFLYPFVKFHGRTMLFDQCYAREKEGTLDLASYVNGHTVIIDQ